MHCDFIRYRLVMSDYVIVHDTVCVSARAEGGGRRDMKLKEPTDRRTVTDSN